MDTSRRWNIYRWIYRVFYGFGLIMLLAGMLLSWISTPAQAEGLRTVDETATVEPPFVKQPVSKQPQQPKGNSPVQRPDTASEGFGVPPLQITLPVKPLVTGSVRFLIADTSLCQLAPGTVEATVEVSLMDGESAILQTSYYIVQPPDLATQQEYSEQSVQNGDQVTVSGEWPGVRPGDQVVEIHFGAILLDPATHNPVSNATGVDFYWIPSSCGQQTAVASKTATLTATPGATATFTPTATLPTVSIGETDTPTPTATVTLNVTETSTPTATVTVMVNETSTPTATVTVMVNETSTPTATVTQISTASPTATATPTPTTPPPTVEVGETNTPTVTLTAPPSQTPTRTRTASVTVDPSSTPTRTRTAPPPTVEAGETLTSTPPPTLTPTSTGLPTRVASATLTRPTPIVIVVTATSEIPVTGGLQSTAVAGAAASATVQSGPLQAPSASGPVLVPVTGADLANQPLSTTSLPFWQRLTTYMGLFMLGIGLIMQGLAKKP